MSQIHPLMAKRILIVDDDPDILEILSLIFKSEGYEVILSADGEETEHIDFILPDLILLDIRLRNRDKNGAIICTMLKSKPGTSHVPVILVSAEKDIRTIAKGCGANAFISKPFDLKQISGKVKEFLLT